MVKTFATKYKSEKLGQHLLIDKNVLNKIIDVAKIKKTDIILEIGPGTGNLTSYLLEKAKKVIAVEKDRDAVKYLKVFILDKNLLVLEDDILKFNIEKEIKGRYKVVANIPYYLTGNLIRTLLERKNKPISIIILVQKEVALRIISQPPNANILSNSVQLYGKPEIIQEVSRKAFSPRPRVESAILEIKDIKTPKDIIEKKFFQIVKVAFSSPRKKMISNISSGLGINKEIVKKAVLSLGFSEGARSQELTVNNWKDLYYKLIKEIDAR
ncbi:ribosomal RNA small subunit methyltransferase A [bacterium]|nr:ribosomal RNA small subunit methyltransferase A [bacterium]